MPAVSPSGPAKTFGLQCLLPVVAAVGDVIAETELENPAWVEVAPCPCDLVFQSCDLHCCCDPVSRITVKSAPLLVICWPCTTDLYLNDCVWTPVVCP